MATQETTAPAMPTGHYIAGEFLGLDEPRDYNDHDGNPRRSRLAIRLLVGRSIETVPFRESDETYARGLVALASERDTVLVPVWLNGPWDRANNRPGPAPRVALSGRGQG